MYSDVVSSVPVMFERRANRLSGYKDQEGGALCLQNQVSDQVKSRLPFFKVTFRQLCFLAGRRFADINHDSGV